MYAHIKVKFYALDQIKEKTILEKIIPEIVNMENGEWSSVFQIFLNGFLNSPIISF